VVVVVVGEVVVVVGEVVVVVGEVVGIVKSAPSLIIIKLKYKSNIIRHPRIISNIPTVFIYIYKSKY